MISDKGSLLLVDDEPNILKTMTISLRSVGYDVHSFEKAEEALKEIDKDLIRAISLSGGVSYDVAFIDLMMFPMNGLVLMQELHRRLPDLTIVIITAHGTVETAVSALKLGAYDYLQKPFNLEQLVSFVDRVITSHHLRVEVEKSAKVWTENPTYLGVLRMAERIANSPLTVLIEGETGTGKELLADFIHQKSDRADKPIIKINCAALSSELIESELFGHTKGSFTGAMKDRIGRLEAANGGTLFLDEIGEMPSAMQAKLLRFLQSREFQRVGENETRYSDVRIIAATNRNLEESIDNGSFREDLFYRLSGVRLLIPPLRLRKEDVFALAERFVLQASAGKVTPEIGPEVRNVLLHYDWRGNVRELENAMLRATILAGNSGMMQVSDLPEHIAKGSGRGEGDLGFLGGDGVGAMKSLDEVERDYIAHVVAHTSSLEEAAKILKIDSATLWRKRKKYSTPGS
ncbi:MAG: sigma-54 dependent transcriptional regulator [Candidatus Kapaibacterium sp.]|jgi:NtrC-family two-component system response regulator AlgB